MNIARPDRVGRSWFGYLLLSLAVLGQALCQTPGFLRVTVLDGDGAFNDIRHKMGHAMSVEVRDQNGQLVAGAEVTFEAPSFGASGTFSNGKRTISTTTDAQGVARIGPLHPNAVEGRFDIAVSAGKAGRSGSAVIIQSNSTAVSVPK